MILLAVALALSPADKAVVETFEKAQALYERQFNQTADEIARLDREIMGLAPQVVKHGYRAVPGLSRAAADKSRPAKLRLFAVSFLGLIRDPSSIEALTGVAADRGQPSWLREAAVESVANLPISPDGRRRSLCKALDLKAARVEAAAVGCDDPAALEPYAREGDLLAIAALGRTPPLDAVRLLLKLAGRRPLQPFRYFPADSPQSAAILQALGGRAADLRGLGAEAQRPLWDTLRHGQLSPAVGLAGIPLLVELQPEEAYPMLLDLLDNPDGGVVAAAAEALAKLRRDEAAPKVQAILDGVLNDPRFGPRKDAPALLERLEAALRALRAPAEPAD